MIDQVSHDIELKCSRWNSLVTLLFCFTVSVVMKPPPSDIAENLPVPHVPVSVVNSRVRIIYCDLLYVCVLHTMVIKLNLCACELKFKSYAMTDFACLKWAIMLPVSFTRSRRLSLSRNTLSFMFRDKLKQPPGKRSVSCINLMLVLR